MRYDRLILATSLALVAAGGAMAQDGAATADVMTAEGTSVGSVTFQEVPSGVLVSADLKGLPPGAHGFHVHETGACSPDFDAAGEHLAPAGQDHGFAATDQPHAADLPNITAADDGTAVAQFVNWRLSLEDLLDGDGSAIMIHAEADDYMDPDSSGDRLACGVIEPSS